MTTTLVVNFLKKKRNLLFQYEICLGICLRRLEFHDPQEMRHRKPCFRVFILAKTMTTKKTNLTSLLLVFEMLPFRVRVP